MAAKKKAAPAPQASRITDREEKLKALGVAMKNMDKDFGEGAVINMGQSTVQDVEVIPTGSLGLDYALGVGGVPRGRITEIYGPESSGKTTLAIHVIAEAQKQGGICAIIDAEHAFDRFYAENLGVDVNNLWIAQPDNGEQALEIAEQLINSGAIDVLVIDSVAALTPKAEIDGEMGEKNMGLHARLMSQAMRKLTGTISRTRTCVIFINQTREKIGVVYGNPETTTGGNALKFYSSVRIEIRPGGLLKNGEDAYGRIAKVKVVKNKVAPPFMKAEFEILFGTGIAKDGEILDKAVEFGIVKKSGAWFSYGQKKLGQGRDAVKNVIKGDPALMAELEEKVKKAMKDKDAENKAKRAAASPFLPSKDSVVVEDEAPEQVDDEAPENYEEGEDLFSDEFDIDI